MPKVGLSSYSLSRAMSAGEMTLPQAIEWAAQHGAEHVEIVPGVFSLTENEALLKDTVKAAADAGIELSNYSIGASFMSEDPAALRTEIDRVKHEVETAAKLGIRFMRHDVASFGGSYAENTIMRFCGMLPQLAAGCAEVADFAAQYGITTSIENHGWFMNGSERVMMLVDAVAKENFRLTMDIGNFTCVEEDPVVAVKRCLPIASVIHFKDFYMRNKPAEALNAGGGCWFPTQFGNALCGAIVGWGDIDIPAIVTLIKQSGFDGYISIEFEGAEECRYGCKCGLALLKNLME